jgi:hypothetical protein
MVPAGLVWFKLIAMKIKIQIQQTETKEIEVDIPNPSFRKNKGSLYKLYEVDAKQYHDQLWKTREGFHYIQKATWDIDKIAQMEEIPIEEYAAALSDFLKSVENDQEDLYEHGIIECHSELER